MPAANRIMFCFLPESSQFLKYSYEQADREKREDIHEPYIVIIYLNFFGLQVQYCNQCRNRCDQSAKTSSKIRYRRSARVP